MWKKILISLLVLVALFAGYTVWFFYPFLTDEEIKTHMGLPFDGHLKQFQFSRYVLPSHYRFLTYYDTDPTPGENAVDVLDQFLLFENRDSKQLLSLTVLKEHPHVSFSQVSVGVSRFKNTHRTGKVSVRQVYGDTNIDLKLLNFIPMLYTKRDITKGRDLILKGMEVSGKEEFETEKTNVLLLRGNFQRLGFFKKSPSRLFQYPATGFDFLKPMHGALAIINDKATGRTIFAVGAQEAGKPFNEEDFLQVVKSLTFDAEPVKEFVDRLRDRGVEAYTKPGKLKIEFGK